MLVSISTFYDGDIAICGVEFEGGDVGFGQLGNKDVDITVELLHRRVAPALLQSGLTMEWNMNEMLLLKKNEDTLFSPLMELVLRFELNYKMIGVQLSKAVAGVDSAIWDAVARAQRCQVWQVWRSLFFPQSNSNNNGTVPVYASSIARSIEADKLAARFLELKRAHGITAFKMKVGTRMQGVRFSTDRYDKETPQSAQLAVDGVHRLIGLECKLAVDCNGAFDSEQDLPTKCWFLEEPYPWFRKPPSRGLGILIAGGEQEFRGDVWQDLISKRVFDIYQPDFGYSGGPSSVLLIASSCIETHGGGLACAPHSPQNDLHPIMAFHMVRAMGTGGYVELACVDDGLVQVKLDSATGIYIPRFAKLHGFQIRKGEMHLTSADNEHGWGIDFDNGWLQRCKVQTSTRTSTQAHNAKRSHL